MSRNIALVSVLVGAFAALAALTVPALLPARAGGVIEVDRTDDVLVSNCTGADNDCSLRGAIVNANLTPATLDTIQVPAGTYTLTLAGAGDDLNLTGDLDITGGVSISGDGENNTFIQAGASADVAIDRVFHIVAPNGSAGITGLTVRHGKAASGGGGIMVEGHLEMSDVAVRDSIDQGGGLTSGGGGIQVAGTASAVLLEVTIAGNESGHGGGFYKPDGNGSWAITDSVITDNEAMSSGGGLFLGISSSAALTDVQVTNNDVMSGDGGGIWIGSDVITITRGSISGNSASVNAGGILAPLDILIDGTLISGNTAGSGRGGGFSGSGTIMNAIITDNSAPQGGGIDTSDLQLIDTAVTGNDATIGGGVLVFDSLAASGVTISGNTASQAGGGLYLDHGDTVALTNTTISGNDAVMQGGGIWRDDIENDRVAGAGGGPPRPTGPVSLLNVTIADNTSDVGAAIFDGNGAEVFDVKNTIVSGNTGGSSCEGILESLGHNLEDGQSCSFTADGDQQDTDPLLGDLGNNGGSTDTHPLGAGSPAINAASEDCPPPATDQRGVGRPINGRCDVGAFESSLLGPPTPTPGPSETATPGPTTTATPGPTGTATATPTPVPTPTGSPGPGQNALWGDNQCDDDVDPVDALGNLRYVASLAPLEQTEPCPEIGDEVDVVEASLHLWGDTDCDDDVDTVDALAILRVAAGLAPLAQTEPCPDIGDEVIVTEG